MKKSIILALALAVGVPVMKAQTDPYPKESNRISIGYDAELMNVKRGSDETFSGFAIQYVHEWKLAENTPVYFGSGLKMNVNFKSENGEERIQGYGKVKYNGSMTIMSFTVPLNFSYKIGISQSVTLQPYTGFSFKVNAIAKGTIEADRFSKKDFNAFDEKDLGSTKWKRSQIGWHIGAGVNVKKFYIGYEYGLDMISLSPTIKTSHHGVSLGLNF